MPNYMKQFNLNSAKYLNNFLGIANVIIQLLYILDYVEVREFVYHSVRPSVVCTLYAYLLKLPSEKLNYFLIMLKRRLCDIS
jgi:hypothetical protein